MKHGALQRAAFAEPGGDRLRDWIDSLLRTQEYSALTFMGGATWRQRLMDDLGDQGDVTALLDRRSDADLAELMENLGGNCVGDAWRGPSPESTHDRPTCFLAYTIKGWGTPIAGHKDNHGGLMNKAADGRVAGIHGVPKGKEWEPFATVEDPSRPAAISLRACRSSPKVRPPVCRGRCQDRRAGDCPFAGRPGRSPPRWPSARILRRSRPAARVTARWPTGSSRHVARRHGNDQSGPLGQPAQAVRPFRAQADAFIEHRIPSTAKWEFKAGGTAYRTGHRRDEPVPAAGRGRAFPTRCLASG